IIGSGANKHMTFGSKLFSSFTYFSTVHYITIANGSCHGRTIGVTKEQRELYYLSNERDGQKVLSSSFEFEYESHSLVLQVWLQHKCLGHLPFSLIKFMFLSLFIQQYVESFKFDICQFANYHCVPFLFSFQKNIEPFDFIHSDDKYEVTQLFIQVYHMVQTQFSKDIKRLCFDNEKEYLLVPFFSKHLSPTHWGEVVLIIAYLINWILSRVLGNVSSLQSMISLFPSTLIRQNLAPRVFRCVAFIHVHQQHRTKLDPRAVRYFVSTNITFYEHVSFFTHPQLYGRIIIWNLKVSTKNNIYTSDEVFDACDLDLDDLSIALRKKGKGLVSSTLFLNLFPLNIFSATSKFYCSY
ncbi:hypothetical protein CR513_13069, partial [Mucuna pruriens]